MCWNFSIPQKKILIFIKYFLEKKSSLSHHITKEKRTKGKKTHSLPPNTPSHTTKRIIPWKFIKTHLLALKNNQTSPSYATQETTLRVNPHPKKDSPIPIPWKKPPLERGGINPSSPSSPKKNPFEKEKIILTSRPFFLKL